MNQSKNNIVNAAEPVSSMTDKKNNFMLDIIEDLIDEMCNERDIDFIIAAAEYLDDNITINVDLSQVSEAVDSYNYLYNMDGAYCLLEVYDTEFINSIINISDLMFYDLLDIDFNALDIKAVTAYLDDINILDSDLKGFFNVLDYQEIFIPDIMYKNIFHSIKNNSINLTYEITELTKIASETRNLTFLEATIETIDTEFIEITTNYIESEIKKHVQKAAIKGQYYNYQILQLYQYQED